MADLVVRNLEDEVVAALKARSSRHGVSVEEEHKSILRELLLSPKRTSFSGALMMIPDVGEDEDFTRI